MINGKVFAALKAKLFDHVWLISIFHGVGGKSCPTPALVHNFSLEIKISLHSLKVYFLKLI